MGKPKRVARRNDIPAADRTHEFEDLLASLGADGLKQKVASAPRDLLDKWVQELAGQTPHSSHPDEFVAASLARWIDGDKNWGDDPKRLQPAGKPPAEAGNGNGSPEGTTHTQAETPEGEEAMTTKKTNGKAAVAATSKKAAKSVPPKKEKVAKEKKGPKVYMKPDGTIIKRPWGERTAWFVKAFKANKELKLTDEKIMANAAKEFGKDNVGKGAWTIEKLRKAMTVYAQKGQYGMSKDDLPLTAHK